MFLEVHDLSKSYRQHPVLHQLSFNVRRGEILVVLGPSGCGKSTLLSCLNGFTDVDNGQVILDGHDITNQPPEERHITTVFQSYSLFPNMTVQQNLAYGLKFQSISRAQRDEKVARMMELLQLTKLAAIPVTEISGGQQQRVALGRSLIVNPQLLLLDEPFSNLDAELRLRLRAELRKLQRQMKMTMIFVTHDQQEALALGDRILLMAAGRIQQLATGPDLYNHPQNQFAVQFIGAVNQLTGDRYVRPEAVSITPNPQGDGIVTTCLFQGATINYGVRYQGRDFQVTCLNRGPQLRVGDRVTVTYQDKKLGE